MKPRANEAPRRSRRNLQGERPNWILIAGSALLSSLSIRLGFKLKQFLDARQTNHSGRSIKDVDSNSGNKNGSGLMHSNGYCFPEEEGGHYSDYAGSRNVETKKHCSVQIVTEPERDLSLVTVPAHEFNKENGVMWSSSPDRLEQPQKPFYHSNSSESPCFSSESGSEIFCKREVIQKLRQQLKRRDDMILEMQDQIAELQGSLGSQQLHSSHLQSLLDASNRELFDLEREIQRLRKAIADHCVGHVNSAEKPPHDAPVWSIDERNGRNINGYPEVENSFEKSREGEKIESLKREVVELKELMESKDYLLQNYKEQKSELSVKVKELQLRLDSQLPNIL